MSVFLSRKARLVAAAAGPLLLMPMLAACDSAEETSPQASGEAPDSVSLVLRNDVDSFDPFKSAAESGAKQMFDAIYDTLVRVSSTGADVEVTGSLAQSWDIKPDAATFTLHDGLTCADGTELKPSGVAQSLQHLADPETGALYASRVFGPDGAKEITADDEAGTVTIQLNSPYTYLLEGLSQGYVVCPGALDDVETLATDPAETGPYEVTELKRGVGYTLQRRETPVVEADQIPATIDMRVIGDDTTRANLVDTGEVDIASILGRDATRLQQKTEPIDGKAFLSDAMLFNQADGRVTADKAVREALSLAVDNAAYAKAATFDLGSPIDTMYTPNMDCYTEDNAALVTGYDLDKAKAVLSDAGYGEGGKKLTINLLGLDTQNSGPELMADSLRQLGVEVNLNKGTLEQALGVLFGTGDWDVLVYPYPVPTPVPSTLVNQISGELGATLNVGSVANDVYDQKVAEAAATEGGQQCELWAEAEAALLENVDVKPLVWSNAAWFTNGLEFDANYFNIDTRSIRANN